MNHKEHKGHKEMEFQIVDCRLQIVSIYILKSGIYNLLRALRGKFSMCHSFFAARSARALIVAAATALPPFLPATVM